MNLDNSWIWTDNAQVWAKKFCELNTASDEGTMIGWFANAIECSHDVRMRKIHAYEQLKSKSITRDVIEVIIKTVFSEHIKYQTAMLGLNDHNNVDLKQILPDYISTVDVGVVMDALVNEELV